MHAVPSGDRLLLTAEARFWELTKAWGAYVSGGTSLTEAVRVHPPIPTQYSGFSTSGSTDVYAS